MPPLDLADAHAHAAAAAIAVCPESDDRPDEHFTHWRTLLERGLIGRPLSTEQRAARAACEEAVRAAERLLLGRSRT
ncbi:MAG: hypothetical protein JOY99_08595 [Sphingomonadaceae bacterium]|nr:hypothetical protein [Sphingomonadaceae bacterium]